LMSPPPAKVRVVVNSTELEHTVHGGVPARLWSTVTSLLSSSTSKTSELSLLDCGGGSGSLAVPLARLGASVTVVDVSIDALGTLMRRATEAGVADRVRGVQGEAESLSDLLEGEVFDVVFAHEVLESVASIDVALEHIAGVLRPGGTLSVLSTNQVATVLGKILTGDVAGALSVLESGLSLQPAPALTLPAIEQACERAGLQPYESEGVGVFTDLVPGIELERPGAAEALSSLEALTATVAPYRDIAARLHVLARRVERSADAS
jgi:S-adenosylmethionine-dependent methyltransferase